MGKLKEVICMAGHRFQPEKAGKLISEERKKLLPPEEILKPLNVEKNDMVVDLGAGNGYFTLPLAKQTNNKVYAVDIEPQMLDMLKERAEKEQLHNIEYTESNLEDIQLPNEIADKAFIAFVMHEILQLSKALEEIKRILKPGGKLLVLEWEAVETVSGPPLFERISSKKLLTILNEHDLKGELVSINPAQYGVICEK
jgi:ubiquinone/menaquinone biosynthesis C-methylase UbiE